jgi:protein-S-isoprenylcysteine O-methyltransferase Ste14
MKNILTFTKKNRILFSRLLIGCMVVLLLISEPKWHPRAFADITTEFVALVMVMVAAFGRLWTLSYISGHKTKDLVTKGPYSIMRNPLYFFSLIGALGIGIASESIIILGSLLLAFTVYYPLVIRAEEEHLARIHGDGFQRYCSTVPTFMPRFSLFHEPTEYLVNARLLRRAFFSVMWFPLAYILILSVAHLQEAGIMPVILSIP